MHNRKTWWMAILLALTTAAVYCGAVQNGFVQFDDDINITRNPHITGLSSENIGWMFTDTVQMRRYVPLAWLGWNFLYECFGLNPAVFHLVVVFFHALNTALVFFLIRRILSASSSVRLTSPMTENWSAAAGACMWGLHPLRVEPVAWASGYLYCQAAFFLLLSFLFYLNYCVVQKRKSLFMGLALASMVASFITYPIGLFSVFLLPIVDVWVVRRASLDWKSLKDKTQREVWLEKAPFFLLAGLVLGLTLWARSNPLATWRPPVSLDDFGLGSRLMQAFYVWAYFVWKPFFPADLSPIYTTLVQFNPLDPLFIVSLTLVVAVTGGLLWKRKEWPLLLAGWLSYLVLLVPMLGLTEHPHYANDRYSYLVAIIGALFVAGLLEKLSEKKRSWRVPLMAGSVGLIAICGYSSYQQIQIWKNNETLFGHMVSKVEGGVYKAPIHNRLARCYESEGREGKAIERYKLSLAELSDQADILAQVAWLLVTAEDSKLRNGAEALSYALRASALEQNTNPRTLSILAAAYAECNRFAEAANTLELAQALHRAEGNAEMVQRTSQLLTWYKQGKSLRQFFAKGEGVNGTKASL